MQRSSDRIHITHAGRLASFSKEFEDADRAKARSQPYDEASYPQLLREATRGVIERQLTSRGCRRRPLRHRSGARGAEWQICVGVRYRRRGGLLGPGSDGER